MNIQFQFDIRTVALFVAMTFFVQATAIGAQAFLIRELKQYRGVGAALLANLCAAAALMLRLFADRLPEYTITIFANALLLTAPGLFYIALGWFTGFAYSKTYVIGVIAVVMTFLVYFTYWDEDMAMRMIALSLGSIAMVLILIYQLWQTRKTSLKLSASLMLLATEFFLERELARVQRNPGEFSVLLIDIDNFKQVNDRWGHITGDHVLVRTAGIFQSMIRKQDWVGRWGGEEFLMIVPGPSDVEALAERVRNEVAQTRFNQGDQSFGFTVSIGIACVRNAEPIDQVLKEADIALYHAKQTKNTVSLAA